MQFITEEVKQRVQFYFERVNMNILFHLKNVDPILCQCSDQQISLVVAYILDGTTPNDSYRCAGAVSYLARFGEILYLQTNNNRRYEHFLLRNPSYVQIYASFAGNMNLPVSRSESDDEIDSIANAVGQKFHLASTYKRNIVPTLAKKFSFQNIGVPMFSFKEGLERYGKETFYFSNVAPPLSDDDYEEIEAYGLKWEAIEAGVGPSMFRFNTSDPIAIVKHVYSQLDSSFGTDDNLSFPGIFSQPTSVKMTSERVRDILAYCCRNKWMSPYVTTLFVMYRSILDYELSADLVRQFADAFNDTSLKNALEQYGDDNFRIGILNTAQLKQIFAIPENLTLSQVEMDRIILSVFNNDGSLNKHSLRKRASNVNSLAIKSVLNSYETIFPESQLTLNFLDDEDALLIMPPANLNLRVEGTELIIGTSFNINSQMDSEDKSLRYQAHEDAEKFERHSLFEGNIDNLDPIDDICDLVIHPIYDMMSMFKLI